MTTLPPTAASARKIIAVDMDEVLADALGEHLTRYNRDFPHDFQDALTPAALRGRTIWDIVPAHRQAVLEQYMLSEDFFAVLGVMPEAQRVLTRLQRHYDIFIASAAMEVPSSFNAKFRWLATHFPFIPTSRIVFCGDKSILHADFLIDDNPRQLRLFEASRNEIPRSEASANAAAETRASSQPTRQGILFTSPANALVTGFPRVDNWLDVEKMFLP